MMRMGAKENRCLRLEKAFAPGVLEGQLSGSEGNDVGGQCTIAFDKLPIEIGEAQEPLESLTRANVG